MKRGAQGRAAAAAWLEAKKGGPRAILWLQRAVRLAPNDPRIALDLAHALLQNNELSTARDQFAIIAERYDIEPAWTGLALAAAQAHDMKAAAQALNIVLSRHCLPPGPDFAAFTAHIAAAAGYGGYTGRSAAGEIIAKGTGRLLGAKPDLAALTRVEGLVAWENGHLRGWAARPAWPHEPPSLWLHDSAGHRSAVRFGKILPADDDAPFLPRYRFNLGPKALHGLTPPFTLRGAKGPPIFGSPVNIAAQEQPPTKAAMRGKPPARIPPRAKLMLLMPIYRGLLQTKAALASVLAAMPAGAELLVVDDASPEPALARHLDQLAGQGRINLRRHSENRGFCAAVNTGLDEAAGRDVLLLNADILLPPGAIETMADLAYAHHETGTVTPLSNEASICSYPDAAGGNKMPDLPATTALNDMARALHGLRAVEIPTAVGFCMFIRHDCLAATGGFRAEIFAQGYGEENDFSLRARHLGFRHMAAPGAFVAHEGGVSFRAAARGLMARNLALLERLHPGYHALVQAHHEADPLKPSRTALDAQRLRQHKRRLGAVLFISHSHGGGVARRVAEDMAALQASGRQALLLTTQFPKSPDKTPYPWPALLNDATLEDLCNLSFDLAHEQPRLLALLRDLQVKHVVLHHRLGHHESIAQLAAALGVPQDIVVHDYASFCPRVNLLNRPDPSAPLRYCGEPAEAGCIACVRRADRGVQERISIRALRARSAAEFAAAAKVIIPSADTARRLQRYFPALTPQIQPWDEASAWPPPALPPPRARALVAVIGGIGPAKGFDVLLDCAADAKARALPLDFIVIGTSADDDKLLAAGIFVTGPYREGEAGALIRSLQPSLAFLPSIWPETWCYALSEAWAAGLRAVVFDLGAQGERMRQSKRGMALPLGLPPQRINDVLCQAAGLAVF